MPPVNDPLLWRLIDITKSLSSEKDKWRLLDRILVESQQITQSDGGTLYLVSPGGEWLEHGIVRNHSLQITQFNRDSTDSALMPIPIYEPNSNTPNHRNIAAHAVLTGSTINLVDTYHDTTFDISGIRSFDELFDYRTQSLLTVPLVNHADQVIGVLQLINPISPDDGKVVTYSADNVSIVQALASLAAIVLDNSLMIEDERNLLIRLSSEKNTKQLFSLILSEALDITHAEGGTLYLRPKDAPARLEFALLKNRKLDLSLGGNNEKSIEIRPLMLEVAGEPNLQNIATYTAISKQLVNVDNAYDNVTFDFSGMNAFDEAHNYYSRSFLSVPLINHAREVIGVLQLVNACDSRGSVCAFSQKSEPIVLALAAYAAIALENQLLLEGN